MVDGTIKESGLKIKTIKEGEGELLKLGQTVSMHYELWLSEGTMSSLYDYEKKEYVDNIHYSTYNTDMPLSGPIEITIGNSTPKDEVYTKRDSIEGLDEALISMRVGGKAELWIPAGLAYGEEGASSFHTFHGYRSPPDQSIRCNIEVVGIIL